MWVLVTGGAKRLGKELCLALAQNGYSPIVHYRNSEKEAQQTVKLCRAFGVKSEMIQGSFDSIESLTDFKNRYLEQFPNTYGLINNVGDYFVGSALDTPIEKWNHLFQTNLHAPLFLSQTLLPLLITSKGRIINIGVSGLLKHSAKTYSACYSMTKESLWMLTRSLAREVAPKGVTVNMVSPGQLDLSIDLPKDEKELPMKRPGLCSEVTRTVLFLLDSKSEYITGQNIEVAGGLGL